MPSRQSSDLRLRHGVIPAQHHGNGTRMGHFAHHALDRRMTRLRIRRDDRRVPVVDDPQLLEGVHLRLQVPPWWAARRLDRPRREARPRPVGDKVVHRRAHDGHVYAGQLGGILRVGCAAVREQPGVVRLVAQRLPAPKRVDHPRIIPRPHR
jgi:hypothetical protein